MHVNKKKLKKKKKTRRRHLELTRLIENFENHNSISTSAADM